MNPLVRQGLVGSVLVAVGGVGAGVWPRPNPYVDVPVLRLLRHSPGPGLCIAVGVLGMFLLVHAWWRLRPAAGSGITASGLTQAACWWAVPLLVCPPLFSRDLYSYATQGLVYARGIDPYQHGPSVITGGTGADWLTSASPTWLDSPAPYGPLFLLVARAAVDMSGGHLVIALAFLRLAAVLGVLALALVVPRLATAYGGDPARAQWLIAANPLVLAHLVAGGHNEAVMLPLFAGALLAAAPRVLGDRILVQGALAGALLGLAAAVKVSAVVALPFVVLLLVGSAATGREGAGARWRVFGRVTAVVSAATVGSFALVSAAAGLGPGWLGAIKATSGVSVQWTSVPTGWGMAVGWFVGVTGRPDEHDPAIVAARAVGLVLTAVLLVALWVRVARPTLRRGSDPQRLPARVLTACGVALIVVIVLGGSAHPWYLLWALVPLGAMAGAADRPHADRWLMVLAIACAFFCFLILPDGHNLARDTEVPGTLLDLVVTVVAGWYAVRWLRRRRART